VQTALNLDDIRSAWAARDPDLAKLIVQLVQQADPQQDPPPREGSLTWQSFQTEMRSYAFRHKTAEERTALRQERLKALEAPGAENPLPERLKVHEVILALWADGGAYAREQLLKVIAEVPLKWGAWRALKRIFKEAEEAQDLEVFGASAARFDQQLAQGYFSSEVTKTTLRYMVRRGWRFLRRLGETLPAVYADAAVEVLRFYPENTNWNRTWISNHIFYHGTGEYGRTRFSFGQRPSTLLKHRAFPELWRRTPRPLFTLLERAESEQARRFATTALKTDFRTTLREVEPAWVARLVTVRSRIVDEFVVWVLSNVPRFEQSALREVGLHQTVLTLLDSPSNEARAFAAAYVRTHARDLPLDDLIRLANNENADVRKVSRDLLRDRDPRKEVGLDAWGRLLGTKHGHDLAIKSIQKHFGARELTKEWFTARLLSPKDQVVDFAAALLPQVHPFKKLGPDFFRDLLDHPDLRLKAATVALDALQGFKLDDLGIDFIKRALVNPLSSRRVQRWIEEERVKPEELGIDFLKALAFHPTWESDAWVAELKASGRSWSKDLEFNQNLSTMALSLMSDVRRFSPDQIGFDWLMLLVQRSEPGYHDFALEYMTKAFLPADFAEKKEEAPAQAAKKGDDEINIDLKGQSFLFTGKLATMTRSQATKKVSTAKGTNASGVSKTLDYLVVGDEGSPFYGSGRKGSKQLKAEKLQGEGSSVKVISETMFLQMLAGEQREFDEGDITAGAERLWEMLTSPGPMDAPLRSFALHYLRRHHPDICQVETDRHVDPGAEIPADFLSFDRIRGLLADQRKLVRDFGLELCSWELARWAPPMEVIVEVCELPHPEVRKFLAKALTAEESPVHKRYRIDPKVLTPEAVYQFCESLDGPTRDLGMELIAKNPRLALPEELFRLTESPDRRVRAFVVRQLWHIYRDRGVTGHWRPVKPPEPTVAKGKKKKKVAEAEAAQPEGGVPPRPESPPATAEDIRAFLRRTLFGLPPGQKVGKEQARLRPMPASRAKLALIEVVRDLALDDAEFAARLAPLLKEFLRSRGKSEQAACLVAMTRIRRTHPDLAVWAEEAA
jgi:hypothetical protein